MNLQPLQTLLPDLTGQHLVTVTAPGGRARESIRVRTQTGTVIATFRKDKQRGGQEARVLELLSAVTDLVPQYLGYKDGYLLQSDLGESRLSVAMHAAAKAEQHALARSAIQALGDIQQAANATDWAASLPVIFGAQAAMDGLVQSVPKMCEALKLPIPDIDLKEIAGLLATSGTSFVKWDARAGNAVVLPAQRVGWFDMEWAGRRSGLEDFAWFYADEFWPVAPDETLALTIALCEDVPHLKAALARQGMVLIAALAVLLTARRVLSLYPLFQRGRGRSIKMQMRMDLPGAHPDLLLKLCRNGNFLADLDPRLSAFEGLFSDLTARVEAKQAT